MKNKLNYDKIKNLKRKVRKDFKKFILKPEFKDSVIRLIVLIERNNVDKLPIEWMERDFSVVQYLTGHVGLLQLNFLYKGHNLSKGQVYFAYNKLQFVNPITNQLCDDYDNISIFMTVSDDFKRELK